MLEGTRKLFPKDYEQFRGAMLSAAHDDSLPATIHMYDVKDFTLKDFQEFFSDFNADTGLEAEGTFFYCHKCDRLHLTVMVSRDRMEEERIFQ